MEKGIRRGFGGSSVRRRWSFALALGAGFALALSLPAQAATDTLDQSQNSALGLENAPQMAQTFTAGMTGQLDRVSLAMDTGFSTFTVQLESVSGTFPAGTAVLGTASYNGSLSCCRRLHDFYFSPTVPVTAGAHYAIVVKIAGRSRVTWYTSDGADNYSGGSLYIGCLNCSWAPDNLYGGDFAFQTWVIGGSGPAPNQAPTVAADSATVNVNEGTAPTMTGTFSDPDGDTVAITASTGTVTPTGTSAGTWSWTQPASDEPSSPTVTVKADDGHGLSATATFTATTIGVAPTVSISRGTTGLSASALSSAPVSTAEGTAVNLNGSASSPSAEDNAAGFTYSWTVTKNGTAFGTGSAAAFSFTPDDEGTYVATLQATDDGNMTGTSSVTVIGTDVAPSAKITSVSWTPQLVLTVHQSVDFAGTFTDPGTLDTHTTGWDFGDGVTGSGLSASHSYNAAGTYTVTFTVTDDDNGVGQATTTVTVQTPQQAMTSIGVYVQGLKGLNGGQKNSLIAKLDAASASITRGNTTAATNQLNAFLNELQTDLNAGRISNDDMTALRGAVNNVQAALGTYNRFLSWIGSL
jgi:PKD repeat protein